MIIGFDDAALTSSTPASSTSGCIASVTELQMSPMMTGSLSKLTMRLVADTPSAGTHWLSPLTNSILRPITPPAALISLAARLAPLLANAP